MFRDRLNEYFSKHRLHSDPADSEGTSEGGSLDAHEPSGLIEDERPFPNFVLIDSPLLVYEEPDAGESTFPKDIKKHFWESVKASFTDAQVIIIENRNQVPDDGTLSNVNVIRFTGNDQGRRGFIPEARGDD